MCKHKCILVCLFVLFTGFSIGQPGFLSLWHTQQSFLLNTMGESMRQHNGYHLGIMRTSSMKWSCRAWQVRTMGDIWAPERALGPCSSKSTERTILHEGKQHCGFLKLCAPIKRTVQFTRKMEEIRTDYPMWFVLSEISSSLKTFVDSCTRLRNFCNTL